MSSRATTAARLVGSRPADRPVLAGEQRAKSR